MVDALLDTAIIVDVLRGYPPAVAWMSQQGQLGLSTVVWMEVIEGATDRRAEQVALRLLNRFERIDVASGRGLGTAPIASIASQSWPGCDGLPDRFELSAVGSVIVHPESQTFHRTLPRGSHAISMAVEEARCL